MTATDLIAKIAMNTAKVAAATEELRRSMAIEELVPDAFAHGTCKLGGSAVKGYPHKGTITITRGDGARVEFEAMEVPFELWPTPMQIDLSAMPAYRRGPIQRRLLHLPEAGR